MVNKILQVSETYWLNNTYTGESLCRDAEINDTTFSNLAMMIGSKTELKLVKADKPILKYELPGEKSPIELVLIEGCYTSPEVTVTAKIENPQNVLQADKHLDEILVAAINSLKELGKSTGEVRK